MRWMDNIILVDPDMKTILRQIPGLSFITEKATFRLLAVLELFKMFPFGE